MKANLSALNGDDTKYLLFYRHVRVPVPLEEEAREEAAGRAEGDHAAHLGAGRAQRALLHLVQLSRGRGSHLGRYDRRPHQGCLSSYLEQTSLLVVPGSSSSFHQSRNSFEGCVDIREIKEIRPNSRESKDFHRWSEDVPQDAKKRCFVIYYGSEFNLKSLSCLTLYAEECTLWCQGTPRLHR